MGEMKMAVLCGAVRRYVVRWDLWYRRGNLRNEALCEELRTKDGIAWD